MTKSNSNGHKKNIDSKKTVNRNSTNGRFVTQVKSEKSPSKSDELTLRAWKKTFENRGKAA